MSLELGRDNKGCPLVERIVTTYRGSIRPSPTFTKQFSATDVFDGRDHIWPVIEDDSVAVLRDVTSFQVRYIWGGGSGRDLDTSSFYINSPEPNLNYKKVGWSQGYSSVVPYLYWGGDNTVSGAECVMFNLEAFKDSTLWESMPEVVNMALGARWYASRGTGDIRIEITAYKHGTIVKAYQISNLDDVTNDGAYIYPLADGTVYIPNSVTGQIEKCWYGEAIRITENGEDKFYKINQVDDSIVDLPQGLDIKISRMSPFSSHHYERGWLVPNEGTDGQRFKIWNNQYNQSTQSIEYSNSVIRNLSTPSVEGTDSARATYCKVMLNSNGTREGVSRYNLNCDVFGFGFIAGNSEFKGQYTIKLNVPSGSAISNPYLAAMINHTIENMTTTIVGVDPMGDRYIEDV